MNTSDLSSLIAESLTFAEKHLKTEGMLGTLVAGFTRDNRTLVLEVPWDNEQEQMTSEMLLKMLFAMEGVEAYTAMSESAFSVRAGSAADSMDGSDQVLLVIAAVNASGQLIGTVPVNYTLEGARIDGEVMLLPSGSELECPEDDRLMLLLEYENDPSIRSVNRIAAQRFLRQFGLDPSSFGESEYTPPPPPSPDPTFH